MKELVRYKLWTELDPESSPTTGDVLDWIIQEMLRLVVPQVTENIDPRPHIIYSAYTQFRLVPDRLHNEHAYLNQWNSTRSDYIAKNVAPPTSLEKVEGARLMCMPEGELGYWLASYLLGFTDKEIFALLGFTDPESRDRDFVPLLKAAMRTLRLMRTRDEHLTEYHRARYLLLRFYMDAYYHEVL